MKRSKRGDDVDEESEPFNNPFRALQDKLGPLPQAQRPAVPQTSRPRGAPLPSRAVLRLERKGRAGKEVTCLELRDLREPELDRWLREIKQLLGCGGSLEEQTLVLQGDQRTRVKGLLLERGVQHVSVG